MELSTVEWVAFVLLLAACLATVPAVVGHVRGTSAHIDQATQLMSSSDHGRARLAGGMHLTWATVFFGSLGVVLGALGQQAGRMVAGTVFVVVMLLDLTVFALGRPAAVILRRHRGAARRRSS